MTKSQINKLGDKLRVSRDLDAEALSRLQQFRASYDVPMLRAQALLRELGLQATSRLKTVNTIIEKLRREKTRLAEMQDIGGLRIVSEVDLIEQDQIVSRIANAFTVTRIVDKLAPRVIDRRRRPTHGYRAVHVIAMLEGRPIEIQIRTQLQDLWAQAFERLADEAGRAVRYGGAPQARDQDVDDLMGISRNIAAIEDMLTRTNQMENALPQPKRAASSQRELRLHIAKIQSVRAQVRGQEKAIRATLESIILRGGARK